ncbi:hypothetical protein ACRAWC_20540 [Leifsonia sp. L25]|uniref:hypothetical protein n=1 Tax=Leifsonia sp. L25 TaxID=3423957 RepID=UPI003D688F14
MRNRLRPSLQQFPAQPHAGSDAGAFDDLLKVEDETPAEVQPASEFPVSFSWNLTPGAGGDPLVPEAAPEPEPQPELEQPQESVPRPVAEPVAPAAAVDETPAPAPAPVPVPVPVEHSSVEAAPEPEPEPEPEPIAPSPASWVIPAPEPEAPAEPEPPRTIFDPLPAAPPEPEQSHGFAALLGLRRAGAQRSVRPVGHRRHHERHPHRPLSPEPVDLGVRGAEHP